MDSCTYLVEEHISEVNIHRLFIGRCVEKSDYKATGYRSEAISNVRDCLTADTDLFARLPAQSCKFPPADTFLFHMRFAAEVAESYNAES